jgi:16S rRNA G966 N2-methylase RsmD
LELRVQDAFQGVSQLAASGEKFDLIFADPPYGEKNIGRRSESFAQKLIDDPNLPTLIKHEGAFVLGHSKRDTLDLPETSRWQERKMLKHGDSIIRILRLRSHI